MNAEFFNYIGRWNGYITEDIMLHGEKMFATIDNLRTALADLSATQNKTKLRLAKKEKELSACHTLIEQLHSHLASAEEKATAESDMLDSIMKLTEENAALTQQNKDLHKKIDEFAIYLKIRNRLGQD